MSVRGSSISLESAAQLLKTRTTRHAWLGLILAVAALILATLLATYVSNQSVTLDGMLAVQKSNPALWFMDLMPFLFLLFGQYTGTVISYEAGAMVLDETRALRERTSALQYELSRSPTDGPALALPRRAEFTTEVRQLLNHPRRGVKSGAVLVIDTEQYHEIRQANGEAAAAEFTEQIARRLGAVVGDDALLAHFGHDDFAILKYPDRRGTPATQIAQRVQLSMDTPIRVADSPLTVRVVVGIVTIDENTPVDADALLRQAESAKYAARAEGRDFLNYRPELFSERGEILRLSADLHAALYADGLAAEFVPQLPIDGGGVHRYRMRPYWPHPRRGRLEESEFLNIADRPSLVHTLAVWQLREGLARFATAYAEETKRRLVIHLPDAAVGRGDLTERLARLMNAHDLPPSSLSLEVTEPGLLTNPDKARVELGMVRAEGISLCLCGLGETGASPSAVGEFPINEVRLAPNALARALGENRDRVVLRKSVEAMIDLGISVIASGINSVDHLDLARDLRCQWAEGGHLSAPVPLDGEPAQ